LSSPQLLGKRVDLALKDALKPNIVNFGSKAGIIHH